MKVLYISSLTPEIGPGAIAISHYNALKQFGHQVDFLTLFKTDKYPEFKYLYKNKIPITQRIKLRLIKKFCGIKYTKNKGVFYRKETEPTVPIRKVLKKISTDYDVIVVFFWQQLLSFKTIQKIYNHCRKKPKVIFIAPDYSIMTGGCHFPGECKNYQKGCGQCPILKSPHQDDFTSKNVKYRQKVISRIHPTVLVNTYMHEFFSKSKVLESGADLGFISITLDLDEFCPKNNELTRKQLQIPNNKNFIILFGCQNLNDGRKGISYLIDALNILWNKLSDKEKESILLLSIGKENEELNNLLKFDRIHLGYIDFNQLPDIYSISNVFASPTINDAGPSMVNQSLACGTPVIAFDIGTALDVIKDRATGLCIPLKNTDKFAEGIYNIFKMKDVEYQQMRQRCRIVAEKFHSYEAFIKIFNQAISQS